MKKCKSCKTNVHPLSENKGRCPKCGNPLYNRTVQSKEHTCPRNDNGRVCNRSLRFKEVSTDMPIRKSFEDKKRIQFLEATCKKHGSIGYCHGEDGKPIDRIEPVRGHL